MAYFSVEVDALRGRAGDILEVAESLSTLSIQTKECAEELGSFSNSFSSIADSLRVVAENVRKGSINSTQLGTALTSIVRTYQDTEQQILNNIKLPKEIIIFKNPFENPLIKLNTINRTNKIVIKFFNNSSCIRN